MLFSIPHTHAHSLSTLHTNHSLLIGKWCVARVHYSRSYRRSRVCCWILIPLIISNIFHRFPYSFLLFGAVYGIWFNVQKHESLSLSCCSTTVQIEWQQIVLSTVALRPPSWKSALFWLASSIRPELLGTLGHKLNSLVKIHSEP